MSFKVFRMNWEQMAQSSYRDFSRPISANWRVQRRLQDVPSQERSPRLADQGVEQDSGEPAGKSDGGEDSRKFGAIAQNSIFAPSQFLHANLAVSLDQKDRIRDLERQLNDANQEVTRLKKEVDRLKQQQQSRNNPFAFLKSEK